MTCVGLRKCVTLCKVFIFFKTGHVPSNKQKLNKKIVEMKHYFKQYKKKEYPFSCLMNAFKAYSLYGKITGKRDEL